jgi:hypothetical protein
LFYSTIIHEEIEKMQFCIVEKEGLNNMAWCHLNSNSCICPALQRRRPGLSLIKTEEMIYWRNLGKIHLDE